VIVGVVRVPQQLALDLTMASAAAPKVTISAHDPCSFANNLHASVTHSHLNLKGLTHTDKISSFCSLTREQTKNMLALSRKCAFY
jgi:hypothetical protein